MIFSKRCLECDQFSILAGRCNRAPFEKCEVEEYGFLEFEYEIKEEIEEYLKNESEENK